MVGPDMKTFETVKKNMVELGLVVVSCIVEWSQTAVHSLSLESRDPTAVGT
jgi:hypothetical protein